MRVVPQNENMITTQERETREAEKRKIFEDESDLAKTITSQNNGKRNIGDMLFDREMECPSAFKRSNNRKDAVCNLLPEHGYSVAAYSEQMFSGKYSPKGDIFAATAQDQKIRFFDACTWKQLKVIQARDVSWAVLDTDYSNDQRFLCYCSWSDKVRLVNTQGEVETHAELSMNPPYDGRFCLFSVKFSPDSLEILGGSCDQCVYLYDLVKISNQKN